MKPIDANSILNDIDCGILILDASLKVFFWNKWLENRTNIKAEDILHKSITLTFPDINEARLKRSILTSLTLNSTAFYHDTKRNYLISIPLKKITGNIFSSMQQKVSISCYDSIKKQACIYIYDITPTCEAQHKLNLFNHELEQRVAKEVSDNQKKDVLIRSQYKQATMGNMVSVIAHQLKQPLSAMSISLQFLHKLFEANNLSQELARSKVTKVMENIEYMSSTIDDFKDFFNPHKKTKYFSLKSCIQKALSLMESQLVENTIRLDLDIDLNVKINSFESELIQVILNIITNSEDALLEQKVETPCISIKLTYTKGYAKIIISDNARGIPEYLINTIFDPYVTSKGSAGTGIGLNICKTIVEGSMNGTISVENKNNGAEFTIKLPTLPDDT